ncbi:MAG: murein biosynthesis integral membrane protein MurJ [Peptococcia bacterium]
MSKSIARAAFVIMIMNIVSRLLGFGRETVIAYEYGATFLTDAYLVAYTIPYFLQSVLGLALVSSIVPVITRHLVKGDEEEAWKIASITMNWTVLFMSILTVLGMAGAWFLVKLTAPGFDQTTAQLATRLTLIMFPSVIFMGAGMLITGILNARKSFAVPAFAPAFSALIIILAVLTVGYLGIEYLAWGTLASFLGSLLIQLPSLKRVGFKYKWAWSLAHPEVKGIFLNLLPIFIGTAVNQIYLAINRIFASGLAEGSISALNYAGKLMNMPMGIFALAISTAIFPTLSEQAVGNNKDALAGTLLKGLRMVLLVTLPSAAGLMALRYPVVKLLFERGVFDAIATQMTADSLFYFCIGMFAMAGNMVLTRAYYAVGDVKTPLYLGLISIGVNVAASFAFIPLLGHSGLALANSLASIFSFLAMLGVLIRRLTSFRISALLLSTVKSLIASVCCALVAGFVSNKLAGPLRGLGTKGLLVEVVLAVVIGVVIYGLIIVLTKEEETREILQTLTRKIGRS